MEISIAIPTMPAKTPTEILRENMVTSQDHARSLVGRSWSARRWFEFDQRIGRILKVAIFNCAKVTLRTALSGYRWLASVAAGSVLFNVGWLLSPSVLANGLAGGWSVAGTTRPSVCHCIAVKGTPISFAL